MISVHQLTISVHDRNMVLNLNTDFNRGQFWAIIGKNGAGKTTLLHILSGLKGYSTGSITIDQHELKNLDSLTRAQKIAILPQTLEASLNCSVQQSVSYGRYPWHTTPNEAECGKKMIDSAIKIMELDPIRKKSIQEISGGELRKVEIATILAQDSDCLMLDEPLNHLDLSFRLKLMKQLAFLSHNKVVIMISHDIQYVQHYCSHVMMILDDGHCIFGTTKDVMTKTNLKAMLGTDVAEHYMKMNL